MVSAGQAGFFISFEGVEGSGKTTQSRRLAAHLVALGRSVWLTREPGGTPLAEMIRQVVLQPDETLAVFTQAGILASAPNDAMTAATELLLMNAARAQLVAEIRRRLEQGEVVITDRFADATRAYQGGGRQLEPSQIEAAIAIATAGLVPDLTILLDADPSVGLARKLHDAAAQREWNRLDAEILEFHQRVRTAYLALAAADPDRWMVIDAHAPLDTIAAQIVARLEQI